MSEFTCINDHPMKAGQKYCDECGEPLYAMDGERNKQEYEEEDEDNG